MCENKIYFWLISDTSIDCYNAAFCAHDNPPLAAIHLFAGDHETAGPRDFFHGQITWLGPT
jgi:hypothetical protein